MTYPIPEAALTQHIAVLGKTGSGKTITSKGIVEHVVKSEGARVCVLDTIKSDWWGLTSSADGKRAGLAFHILGGPRGHVPLHESAGKAIGDLVATGQLPLSIIDMADFKPGGQMQFFAEFAPQLFKRMRGVVYLVLEEAHVLCPKERAGFGHENMSIHWAKTLATAARSRGIRLIVCTQRTQALHNAVLGSCDTLIAHRLTAPADQEPVTKWLKANVDKTVLEQVTSTLSSLPTGTAWVCSGEAKLFERVAFPMISTFDNSATPEANSGEIQVHTAPVDREKLRSIIGIAVQEAEENDPKRLKAEIATLKGQLSKATTISSTTNEAAKINVPAIEQAARANGYQQGWLDGERSGFTRGVADAVGVLNASAREIISQAAAVAYVPGQPPKAFTSPKASVFPNLPSQHKQTPQIAPISHRSEQRTPSAAKDTGLKKSLQRVIDAIAWWRFNGVEPVRRERATVVAGLSPKASTFGVYIAELVRMGLVDASTPGAVSLTAEGLRLAHEPEAAGAADLRRLASDLLTPAQQKAFDVVYNAWPNEIRRDAVADALSLSRQASTTGVYLSAVAALGIIETSSPGCVKAADWLFPEGR